MKISITASCLKEDGRSEESLERLLRIAFTRYASLLRQVRLDLQGEIPSAAGPGFWVRLIVCVNRWPDVKIEELQPRLELAVDRAIHRTDGVLRQYARREGGRAR